MSNRIFTKITREIIAMLVENSLHSTFIFVFIYAYFSKQTYAETHSFVQTYRRFGGSAIRLCFLMRIRSQEIKTISVSPNTISAWNVLTFTEAPSLAEFKSKLLN